MRKIKKVILLALILLISQVPRFVLSGKTEWKKPKLEASLKPNKLTENENSRNPMISLGLFFSLLKTV
jgi:hypothetical protein